MIVGIEISPDALRAACLERFRRGRRPEHLGRELLSPLQDGSGQSDAAVLSASLSQLLSQVKAEKPTVAVAVPSAWCAFREAPFPYRSSSRVVGTLRYALEGRLPGPVEDYVIEPVSDIIPAGDKGARVLLAACPTACVEAVINACRRAGVEPCIIQPAAVSLARYLDIATPKEATRDALLIRIMHGVCELALLREGEPASCHVARLGDLDPGSPAHVEPIAERIRFAWRACHVGERTPDQTRVLLLAPPETGEAFVAALHEKLGLPVEMLVREAAEGSWAGAWGVAVEAAQRKHAAPNLRRGPYAYLPYARRVERKAVAALLLAIAIVWVLGVHTWRGAWRARRELAQKKEEQRELFLRVTGLQSGPPVIRLMRSALKDEAAGAERTQATSCLSRWQALTALNPERFGIRIHQITIDQRMMTLSGKVSDSANVWTFRESVERSSDQFLPESPEVTSDRGKGTHTFTMKLKYR